MEGDGVGLVARATTLHGLGRVSKTTVALHHAHAITERHQLIRWITAGPEEQISEARDFGDHSSHWQQPFRGATGRTWIPAAELAPGRDLEAADDGHVKVKEI